MRGFKKIGKELLTEKFLLYLFIVGLLFWGKTLVAAEDTSLYDEDLHNKNVRDENPFLSLNGGRIIAPPFQGWGVDEINDPLTSLDGIDGDNALGEEEVPVGDGSLILVGFCALLIIYRIKKQSKHSAEKVEI